VTSVRKYLRALWIRLVAGSPGRFRREWEERPPIPLAAHVLVMLLAALAVLAGLLWLLTSDRTSPLTAARTDQITLEVIRLAFYAVAGIGGVIALTVAYRRQRLSEIEVDREDAKLYNERFAAAADQLSSERAANRLAGVYAMAALADEWGPGRQTCVNVLCAYLRMPYEPPPRRNEREAAGADQFRPVLEERLVRKTVVSVLAERLRAAPVHGRTWHGCDFDFTGATFDEGDLSRAVFTGSVTFSYARFPFATFDLSDAKFMGRVDFSNARFLGAAVDFSGSHFLGEVDCSGITVSGGEVRFRYAAFTGEFVSFSMSDFAGGTVLFEGCRFGPDTKATFVNSQFSGAYLDFSYAELEGARLDFGRVASWEHPPHFDDFPDGPPRGLRLPEYRV